MRSSIFKFRFDFRHEYGYRDTAPLPVGGYSGSGRRIGYLHVDACIKPVFFRDRPESIVYSVR